MKDISVELYYNYAGLGYDIAFVVNEYPVIGIIDNNIFINGEFADTNIQVCNSLKELFGVKTETTYNINDVIKQLYYSILSDYVEVAKQNPGKFPSDIEECKQLRLLIDYVEDKYSEILKYNL